ncbi:hypothetical protein VTP01DRAFT_8270 [Rhizomucor pusillus]|uniref:uncharacterized protein n=1 Tax=Rhizomucor pusillus TaxID=4840 RepID=UPI003742F8A8
MEPPAKCLILASSGPPPDFPTLTLYDTPIPHGSSFPYLGVSFGSDGTIDAQLLVQRNAHAEVSAMRTFHSISVLPTGLGRLLCSRLYSQFIRPKMMYGLAICTFNKKHRQILESAQSTCLRMIYGAHHKSSTVVMAHLANLPSMTERITILQAKLLLRAYNLPGDALLTAIIPLIQRARNGSWYKLKTNNLIWRQLPLPRSETTTLELNSAIRSYRRDIYKHRCRRRYSKLINQCRKSLGLDPILKLPMSRLERSLCIRWRLGWLPSIKPLPCPKCSQITSSRRHLANCFDFNHRLRAPRTVDYPISFILNRLPKALPNLQLR